MTNSFAALVDRLNPANSPFSLYTVANGNPGVDTPGVDILMESSIPDALFFTTGNPLRNDDYAGRQFLYPVPEPGTVMLLGFFAGSGAAFWRRSSPRS